MRLAKIAAAALVAVAAAVAALALRGDPDPEPQPQRRAATTATAPAPAATPATVLQAVSAAAVEQHLRALTQAAGSAGTRAAGTPGDAATREHVAAALRAAGWRVAVQQVPFPFFDERRRPRVVPAGGRPLTARDARTLAYSAGGRASGRVRAIGLAPGRASDAGCAAGDFAALRRGEIALVQRGTCEMRTKARNAQAAGASAVLVANDGVAGRTGVLAGTLGEPGLRIPAVFLSTAAARSLARDGRATVDVDAVSEDRMTANVIAEIGDGPRVAMAGAHLDSVEDGPGLNDDGSGVAALLAAAEAIGGRAPEGSTLRLGFWGAEELGLHGSRRYVARLDRAGRERIAAYVNLDMVGTPGGRMDVYEGDDAIRDELRAALRERGRAGIGEEDLGASSDHAPFARAGIPVGGLFTGLDRCYHRACDVAGNTDPERAADAGAATAATLLRIAAR